MLMPRIVTEDFRITSATSLADFLYDMLKDFRMILDETTFDKFMEFRNGKEPYKGCLLILYEKFVIKILSLVDDEITNPSRAGLGCYCLANMKEG